MTKVDSSATAGGEDVLLGQENHNPVSKSDQEGVRYQSEIRDNITGI